MMIRSGNTFNFGKWKGVRVSDVANMDSSYIYFCENRLGYEFSPKVKRACRSTDLRNRHLRTHSAGMVPAFF